MKPIRFVKPYSKWNVGETARFSDTVSNRLMSLGVATLIESPSPKASDEPEDKQTRPGRRRSFVDKAASSDAEESSE